MALAHEEITKQNKELKNLLTVSEFLLENQEEIQTKLDEETAQVEDAKRAATTYKLKFE